MNDVQAGIWHWQAPHPEWNARGAAWGKVVSSYALEVDDRLLLFDPLALPAEIEELAAGRETVMVLTCPWHRRDAPSLGERHGWPIYVPPPDPPDPVPSRGRSSKPASVCRLGSRRSLGESRTTRCSGSKAGGRWSPGTR